MNKKFLSFFVSVLVVLPFSVMAATCDPAFNEVLESKGWLAGQRDIQMAQSFIRKGNSVLEYSCFKRRVRDLDGAAWSNEWTGINLDGKTDFKGKFEAMIGTAISGAASNCALMQQVWHSSKCNNVSYSLLEGDFIGCAGDATTQWGNYEKVAFPAPAKPGNAGGMHGLHTFLEVLYLKEPPGNPQKCKDVKPLPTGVVIDVYANDNIVDAVCPVIGCGYNKAKGYVYDRETQTISDPNDARCM